MDFISELLLIMIGPIIIVVAMALILEILDEVIDTDYNGK